MQPLTCRTYHSWKSDSIRLESVEIACSFFLGIRLFPYSVDDFDSYSNKLCESSLERIRVSIRIVSLIHTQEYLKSLRSLLFNFGIKKISTIKKKFLRISISNSREFLKILIRCQLEDFDRHRIIFDVTVQDDMREIYRYINY